MNIKKICLISGIIFWIVWFLGLNLFFTVREVRRAYETPNVTVQLNKPVYGIYNYKADGSNDFGLEKITSGFAYSRSGGRLWIDTKSWAFVSFEKTIIKEFDSKRCLSEEEIEKFLSDICEGKNTYQLDYRTDDSTHDVLLNVNGKYEGTVYLKHGHLIVPVGDTNLNIVWSAREHFPYMTVISCLISSVIIVTFLSAIGFFVSKRVNKISPYLLINGIPAALLIAYVIFLSTAGYFAPI